MTQIFIFGASIVYGVGGSEGGWADMLKHAVHQKMYGADGIGEVHEVFNFAKPGATVAFVAETFQDQIKHYGRPNQKVVAVLSVGMNNARALDNPNNIVSTEESFRDEMTALVCAIKEKADDFLVVGYTPVDERKTCPKPNPLSGGFSYFFNKRIHAFNRVLEEICQQQKITYIKPSVPADEWIETCLCNDGLHPNDKGHEHLFERVWERLALSI